MRVGMVQAVIKEVGRDQIMKGFIFQGQNYVSAMGSEMIQFTFL